jgi:hypothetical protein
MIRAISLERMNDGFAIRSCETCLTGLADLAASADTEDKCDDTVEEHGEYTGDPQFDFLPSGTLPCQVS